MSLQFRLNLAIALSMLLILSLGTVFTIYNARRSVEEEVQSSMNLALQVLEPGRHELGNEENSVAYWRSRMGLTNKTRHLRVRIELPDGNSIDLSRTSAVEPKSDVPAWFVGWIKPQPLVKTLRVDSTEGLANIWIRDDPNDEIVEVWGESKALFGLILFQSLLVGILVHIILGRALRSVPIILNGLESIESGNFQQKLPAFSVPEISRISRAINHTAAALHKAHQENRALAGQAISIQEEERRVLSRELHDELGQSLTGIKVTLASIIKESPNSRAAVGTVVSICDHLFSVVRSMMRRLRPTLLDELGLTAALEDMVESWRKKNSGITVNIELDEVVDICDDTIKIHVFRIIQECLNNIARHASASAVEVKLQVSEDPDGSDNSNRWIIVKVVDNGCGFNSGLIHSGFGLFGIRERIESLDGHFLLLTEPDHGVAITVTIPYVGDK